VDLRRQRINEAQRTGLRNRIRDHWHVPEERANALIEAWDQEAAQRSLSPGQPTYWHDAEAWIRDRLEPRSSQPQTRKIVEGADEVERVGNARAWRTATPDTTSCQDSIDTAVRQA
jgi:hypothetical protein